MSTNPCPDTDLHRPYPRTLTITYTYTLTPVNVDALRYFFNRQTLTPAPLDLLTAADTDRPSPLNDWTPRQPTRWEPIPMILAHHVCERGR